MKDIKTGDTVMVVMARNNIFPWQSGPSFPATFYRGPQGPGDTFTLAIFGVTENLQLNSNSSEFVGLYLLLSEDDRYNKRSRG